LDEAYVAEPKQFKQVSELVSQKTKDMHQGLYKNYIQSLNDVSSKLDTADRSEANPRHSEFRSLKLDESYNLNAVWLHELYFANCFDPHSEIVMDSKAYLRLQRDFGTFDTWQKDFMATAMSAGNGWAVCGYHMFLRRFVNMIVSHHSGDVMLGVFPVIVVDMWEHSYTRDYLSDKKSYLVSQMKEFKWSVIEERVERAELIAQAVKS
jgi:Fe-Mn family superoxide dismutase